MGFSYIAPRLELKRLAPVFQPDIKQALENEFIGLTYMIKSVVQPVSQKRLGLLISGRHEKDQ
jgi:hypothetical protein